MSIDKSGRRELCNCLIATYSKENLQPLVEQLHGLGLSLYASAGTSAYLKGLQIPSTEISELTQYPELLGGRVKTLHPKVFGGLLYRSEEPEDLHSLEKYEIPRFDLLIVDLYPFEAAVQQQEEEDSLIEKIDIGGVALLRAAAKNFHDIWVISSAHQYEEAREWLSREGALSTLEQRRSFALEAFRLSAHYDTQIFSYFNRSKAHKTYQRSILSHYPLRYGENSHQQASFYGPLDRILHQQSGQALSYNNLLDIDAAFDLLRALSSDQALFVMLKHGNPCGVGLDEEPLRAYQKAYATDRLSAFGGVFATNRRVDREIAAQLSAIFFEVILAPELTREALDILSQKKKLRILQYTQLPSPRHTYRSALGGMLEQTSDLPLEDEASWEVVTSCHPTSAQYSSLRLAYGVVSCARSNAIVLAKDGQLLGCGAGQTSRIDALEMAIQKARRGEHDLEGAVMASEAFFPFPDCVEMAHQVGISAVIQPGGSMNDHLSVDFCETHHIPLVLSRRRHFRH